MLHIFFAKGHRYMIFKSNRSVGVCPHADQICYVYNRFLTNAHYEVLLLLTLFIANKQSNSAQSSLSKSICKKIFSHPNIKLHKIFKLMIKSYKWTRFF